MFGKVSRQKCKSAYISKTDFDQTYVKHGELFAYSIYSLSHVIVYILFCLHLSFDISLAWNEKGSLVVF